MSGFVLAVPSKGRLMEAALDLFARAGLPIEKADRGYRGRIAARGEAEVAFLSSGEIAEALRDGKIDAGVTGEDLLRETAPGIEPLLRLGFGPADVVVAVPASWLDCARMSDLDDIARDFYRRHGRRLRVATKYPNLARRHFAAKGVTGYRIVASTGATEGAPAQGLAEAIVDITTSGATLTANRLKVLDDGVILKSQAVLAAAREHAGVRSLAAALAAAIRG